MSLKCSLVGVAGVAGVAKGRWPEDWLRPGVLQKGESAAAACRNVNTCK